MNDLNIQKICQYLKDNGSKHFSRPIKKDLDLWNDIQQKTIGCNYSTTSEQIYLYINGINVQKCKHGNNKRFIGFEQGYNGGCKDCTKEQTSKTLKETLSTKTKEEKKESH